MLWVWARHVRLFTTKIVSHTAKNVVVYVACWTTLDIGRHQIKDYKPAKLDNIDMLNGYMLDMTFKHVDLGHIRHIGSWHVLGVG